MAKKTPKTNTSAVETTRVVDAQTKAPKKVNSKVESQKSKKSAQKTGEKKPNIFKRMAKALKGVFSELKKVTWLKGKEVGKNTAVVLVVVVLFFIVLFIIDYVLGGLLGLITNGRWTTVFI